MMGQSTSILLVELGGGAQAFVQALAQVGRDAVPVTEADFEAMLAGGSPLAVIAPSSVAAAVGARLRAAQMTPPFFVLMKATAGSSRPPLPDVTACVPDDIDPGILALRMQQALQQAGAPRVRQATVIGLGSMSRPQPLAPTPIGPGSSPLGNLAAPTEVIPPAPPPPSVPARATAASSAPPGVPSAPQVVTSAPPVLPGTPLPPASAPALPKSVPPLATSAPASPPSPSQSGLSSVIPPSSQPPTDAPVMLSSAALGARAPGPVTLVDSIPAEALLGEPSGRSPWMLKGAAMMAILAVVGGAGAVWLKKSNAEGATAENSALTATQEKAGGQDKAGEPQPADSGAKDAKADLEPKADAVSPPPSEVAPEPKPAEAQGEALFYKVEGAVEMPGCETVLGKSPDDFAKEKKWRAVQAWKLSRKSLMAGQEETALAHMCEAAFIDPSSNGTTGLVKFYLGKRALSQAKIWAEKAVEASSGASSKRAAQQLLGDVHSQLGEIEEARKLWLLSFNLTEEQTDRLGPVCRNFLNAALKSRKGGDSPLAEQLLRRASFFNPKDGVTAAVLASTLLDNGQPALAKRWAERALELDGSLDMAKAVLTQVPS